MDIQLRKINLIQELINIENENVLTIIETVIKKSTYAKNEFQESESNEFFEKRILQSLHDIEEGKVTGMKELEEEIESWQ
jgi:hypothetical protein